MSAADPQEPHNDNSEDDQSRPATTVNITNNQYVSQNSIKKVVKIVTKKAYWLISYS